VPEKGRKSCARRPESGRISRRAAVILRLLALVLVARCGAPLRRAIHSSVAPDQASLQQELVPLKDFEGESWLRTVDARIIAMGEPNHGSRQPRQIQTEVILAAHALFPRLVLFGEWCDSEGRELNAYIHGHNSGEAPPKIAGPIIWSGTWEVA